jgi:plastocyanin
VTFQLTAQNVSFDKTEVRARAGAQVTAVLINKDGTVEHNLTFSAPGLPHGETCTGPCMATQTFTAPAPGRYNFFCNIHSSMIGDFIVDP